MIEDEVRADGGGGRRLFELRDPVRVQRVLITVGLLIALAGLLWPLLSKLPLGRLPGDLVVDKPGFKLFAPFTFLFPADRR